MTRKLRISDFGFRILFLLCASVPLWLISFPAQAQDKPAPIPDNVSYYKDVRPIFVLHCQGCHQPAKPMGGFVMTSHADLLKKGDSEEPGVLLVTYTARIHVWEVTTNKTTKEP